MPLDELTNLITGVQNELGSLLEAMAWAEEEIGAAAQRHPCAADRIWNSFALLRPTHPLLYNEMLHRAHCAELLDRVARGDDTRPATAAECCAAMAEVSLQAPLRTSAVGLYIRMWRQAGLPPVDLAGEHYEALDGSLIDDNEAWLRAKLRQPSRVLPDRSGAAQAGRGQAATGG